MQIHRLDKSLHIGLSDHTRHCRSVVWRFPGPILRLRHAPVNYFRHQLMGLQQPSVVFVAAQFEQDYASNSLADKPGHNCGNYYPPASRHQHNMALPRLTPQITNSELLPVLLSYTLPAMPYVNAPHLNIRTAILTADLNQSYLNGRLRTNWCNGKHCHTGPDIHCPRRHPAILSGKQ